MAAKSNYQVLINRLDRFIRKYYLNKLIRGVLYTVGLVLAYFLLISVLEYYSYSSQNVRKFFFFSFVSLTALAFGGWVLMPLLNYFKLGKVISHQQAADIIGTHFVGVKDKLLNVLQLKSQARDSHYSKELIEASIDQKIDNIKLVRFRSAIDLSNNKQYLKYALAPLTVLAFILFLRPSMIKESTSRIISYDKQFEKAAPFNFSVSNDNLEVIQFEDFLLNIEADGEVLPTDVNVFINDFPYRATETKSGEYNYKFNKLQKTVDFYMESGGFKSKTYTLEVIPKPAITSFTVEIDYPAYTGKKDELVNNTGDMVLPMGTKVNWSFESENADLVNMKFAREDTMVNTNRTGKDYHTHGRRLYKDTPYMIYVSSEKVPKADSIGYSISVIPDLYPEITAQQFPDSADNKLIYFLGDASDDYGIKGINFRYNVQGEKNTNKTIAIEKGSLKKASRYTYTWDLHELELSPGDKLSYYFEVWDNDGVKGSKVSRSNTMVYELPTLEELEEQADEGKEEFKADLQETIDDAKDLKKEVKALQEKIIEKKELNWEDKKQIEKLLEKQKSLQKNVENVQNKFKENNEKEEEFKEFSEEMQDKKEQLEKLMEEVLTDEMKEMLEKMEEMMEEMENEEMMEELEDMELDNEQLERELDRMMELMKEMELEQKMQETVDKLEELAKEEEELAEETEKNESGDLSEEKEKQEEIQEEFEKVKEDMEEITEMQEELEKDTEGMKEQEEMSEQAEQEMEQGQEEMEQKENQKASKSQKSAAQQMQQMAQQMQQQMQEMQQEQESEDLQAIRQLLENLIDMSFDQERVIDEIEQTTVNNPTYTDLVQQQHKLLDDFQIIEDSVLALASRSAQIESFVIKELSVIDQNFTETIDHLEDRKVKDASVNQQYIMTSVNNLALMLSESMQQMQQQMASQMPGSGNCNKPGGSGSGMSGMKKMQQQLNEQLAKMMEQMGSKSGDGKSGDKGEKGKDGKGGMSKQFAETAKKQAAIREAMKQFNKENNKDGKGDLGDLEKLMEEMEKTEEDIVNKKITQELIERQKEIMSKLLEAEEAERQRGQEEKRQGETAQERVKNIPPQIEEYLKKRESEVELYKTVSPELRPYYKELVEKYFKSISF